MGSSNCKEPPHLPPSTMEAFVFRGADKKQDHRCMAKTFPCNKRRSGIDEIESQSQSMLKMNNNSNNGSVNEPKAQRHEISNTNSNEGNSGSSCLSGEEDSALLPEPIVSDPLQGANAPSAPIIVLDESSVETERVGKAAAERSERQGGAADVMGLKAQVVEGCGGPGGKELISKIPTLNKQKR